MGTLAERKQSTCYLINRLCYSFSVCVPVYSFVVHVCFAGPDPDGVNCNLHFNVSLLLYLFRELLRQIAVLLSYLHAVESAEKLVEKYRLTPIGRM